MRAREVLGLLLRGFGVPYGLSEGRSRLDMIMYGYP